MDQPNFDAHWVLAAAAAQGLCIPPERVAAVLANLERIAAVAAPVLAEPLAAHDEPGPVFRP